MDCWRILGIEITDDKRAIKKAYAMKSRDVHPEEHPEEFRKLHEAYEYALHYADNVPKSRMKAPVELPKEETDVFDSLNEYEPDAFIKNQDEDKLFDAIEEACAEETVEEAEEDVKIDFDEILEHDTISYFENVVALTQKTIEELEKLYNGKKRKLKAWNEVCKSGYFCEAGRHPFFIENITNFVKERTDLPKNCYKALYDIYNFDDLKTRADKGYLGELYEIFEQRDMLKVKNNSATPAIWGGIAAAIVPLLRIASSDGGWLAVIGVICFAAFIMFLVFAIVKKLREEEKKTPEIKALEKKRKQERKKEINPTWNPALHVKRNQYYAKEVPLAWNALLLLSIFWLSNYEDDASIMISLITMIISSAAIVSTLFTNIIIIINSKINDASPISLSTKKLFRFVVCANIWMFLLNIFMIFAEESTSTAVDVFGYLLFGVPIGWLVIKGIADDIKKKREKNKKV